MGLGGIHWHDSIIRRIVELPEENALILELNQPIGRPRGHAAVTVTFRDVLGYSVREEPFVGSLTIVDASVAADGARMLVTIETSAGRRTLSCVSLESVDGHDTPKSSSPATPEAKAHLAARVLEARATLDERLQRRAWPKREFVNFREAVMAYASASAGDELVHRGVASAVREVRDALERRHTATPSQGLYDAERLETLLFDGYDPWFEGDEPPDL